MKAGVVSDTHGNIQNLEHAVEWLEEVEGIDALIHLGDDASDVRELHGLNAGVVSVPGVFESAYSDKKIPNRLIDKFDGIRVLLTHTPASNDKDLPGDLKPEDVIEKGGADVILHGHTHRASIEKTGRVSVINPGHLKASDARGGKPTFAVIDFGRRQVEIISLEDKSVVMRGVF